MRVKLTDGAEVDIEELTERDDIVRVMDDLQEQVNVLDAAVRLMGANAYATKRYKMPKDYYHSLYVIKHYRQAIQVLKRELTTRKAARKLSFERAFVEAARQKMTGEAFDAIVAEAKRMVAEQQQEEA